MKTLLRLCARALARLRAVGRAVGDRPRSVSAPPLGDSAPDAVGTLWRACPADGTSADASCADVYPEPGSAAGALWDDRVWTVGPGGGMHLVVPEHRADR